MYFVYDYFIFYVNELLTIRLFWQYVRLADDTPIEDTMELLNKHWEMTDVNLVICLTASDYSLDGKKKEMFTRGLVNVSSLVYTSVCQII